jgi:hypothetical protein
LAGKRITLDGQVLEGFDEYGEWGVHTFEGWWDSPEPKERQVERPVGSDGDMDTPVDYKARYPTLTGIFIADSEAKMFEGMNRFSALLQQPSTLEVVGYGRTQWATVKRASGLVITPRTDRVCIWQARVKADDPRKYGASRTFAVATGSPVTAFHRGTYPASPSFIIRGSMPGGYTITVDGWNYTVTKPLVTGFPHRIDYNDGDLYVNGTLTQNSLGNTNLRTIPPGPGVGVGLYPVSTGSGSADMTVWDTYI